MALYDSKLFVLSHVRHSNVLSDETGNASHVLFPGDVDYYAFLGDDPEDVLLLEMEDELLQETSRSFDIRSSMSHRLRSNTEIKFEKFKRERRNAMPKTKIISWSEPQGPLDPHTAESLFILKEDFANKAKGSTSASSSGGETSLLSQRLSSLPERPSNPFTLYANFDASASGSKTVKMRVFVPASDHPDLPFDLHVLPPTKIHEIIGLSCYKYSQENRTPPLKPRVDAYGLFWADDRGHVESDFPALERRDPISKFGFTTFGLVDIIHSDKCEEDKSVIVFLPDGTFTELELPTKEITMQELIEKSFSRRKFQSSNPRISYQYNIERKDTPGIPIDPNTILSSLSTNEFYIVRLNSKRRAPEASRNNSGGSGHHERSKNQSGGGAAADVDMYQLFQDIVIYTTKIKIKVLVDIGISDEKIEIYPKRQGSSTKFWAKQKSASYKMEHIVACDILDKKSSGNWAFNFVFVCDNGYDRREFECPGSTASKIHAKINQLLSLHSSPALKKYLEYQEKKLQRRQSWHFNIK